MVGASIDYLTGTWIEISGQPDHLCKYNPPLAEAGLVGEKIWFHYAVNTSYGRTTVTVSNFPLPGVGGGKVHISYSIYIPRHVLPTVRPSTPEGTTVEIISEPGVSGMTATNVIILILGGLGGLMILSFCYLIYKSCGSNVVSKTLGFKNIPKSPMAPTPVLVVYPAESAAFHRAVVELAEFLQWHGGCSVAIDMWQQEKIAELGPMRWLAEQANRADQVLIVCPQPSSESNRYHPNYSFPEPCVPAAAHDLYPLVLNMVASHAKSASELAKFCVVQLGEQQVKRPQTFPLELMACKSFCLMKDLNKLCKSLCAQCKGGKMSNLLFRPVLFYNEKSTAKLREAVEMLKGHQPSISKEEQLLVCSHLCLNICN
ncbi:uncharacterized protein il17rb isoform X2 [Parambassis ranga]|uniref:Uncharacterized protein il17rb isoform X2 n=1 Tax=Parambassis ranga TaxID=210632 RepID=A0A6P7IK19_9TELE|nr:interleukin-17 receptor B isoform X2 [Parambassis ranga]